MQAKFDPEAIRRFASGSKRATVLLGKAASHAEVGGELVAVALAGTAQVPLRIVALHQLQSLDVGHCRQVPSRKAWG